MGKTRSAEETRPAWFPDASGLAPALVLILVASGYFLWFFQQSAARFSLLHSLSDPFGFVAEWFGPAGTPLGLFDRVPILLIAGLILAAAYGLGCLVVDRLTHRSSLAPREELISRSEMPTVTGLECFVFALAIGLNLFSTLTLLIGLAGLLAQHWLMWLVVVALAGWAAWQLYRDHWSRLCKAGSALRVPTSALVWVAIAFSIVILLGACLPPWDFDVREYHLQVPKEWQQHGQITFLPHNVYGNMPLAAEMHALLAMSLWPGELRWFYGALAGKVVLASYAIITALGLAAAGERLAGKWAGWLAACVYLAHPWVVHVSISGLNDGALACYVFLAAYAMWLARRGACNFLLPGLLAGGAAACKYPGLAFAVAPLAVWCCVPVVGRISNPSAPDGLKIRPTMLALALFLGGVLAGGGAWYAKNAALAGNPVYPLAYDVFGGRTRTPAKDAQWQRAHQVPPDQHGRRYSLKQLAAAAARIAGRDDLSTPLILPLLVAGLIAAFIPRSALPTPHSLAQFALLLLLVLAVWWLFSHRIDRFLLPAWPLAALIAAVGAAWLDEVWWRRTVQAIALVGLAYCLVAASSPLVGDNRWFVSLAQLHRDGPWPEGTPLRIGPAQQFLNDNDAFGDAALLVGDAAPFDLEMPVFYSTCFDDCLLCDWMIGKSAQERREQLASRGIAWVLVDWPEIGRYQSPGNYGFDPRFRAALVDELVAQRVLGPPQPMGLVGKGRPAELYPVLRQAKPARPGGV